MEAFDGVYSIDELSEIVDMQPLLANVLERIREPSLSAT
jgi:hypothetical protein